MASAASNEGPTAPQASVLSFAATKASKNSSRYSKRPSPFLESAPVTALISLIAMLSTTAAATSTTSTSAASPNTGRNFCAGSRSANAEYSCNR
eukprot:10510224-Alexandrium_andersonii.AAC.1